MEPRAYLISVATAAALAGYAAGEWDGFEARAAQPVEHSAVVRVVLGSSAQTTLANFLKAQMCSAAESQFSLTTGSCDAATFRKHGVMLSYEDTTGDGSADSWVASSNVRVAGTWLPGDPQ